MKYDAILREIAGRVGPSPFGQSLHRKGMDVKIIDLAQTEPQYEAYCKFKKLQANPYQPKRVKNQR